MKKVILFAAAALMAVSLAACTPTPEKEAETAETMETTSGEVLVAGKVPGPEEVTISVYSINDEGTGLQQNMDALEEMTDQGIVDKLIEYEILDEGTTLVSFEKDETSGIVNLSALPDFGGDEFIEKATLEALINTYIENYELELVKIQVNGEDVSSELIETDENGYATYFDDFEDLGM